MSPWLILSLLVAGANWALFLALRGRWGRISLLLAIGSWLGTVAGDAVGRRTGLELVQIGDFHLVAASLSAQLVMLMVLLFGSLVPSRAAEHDESEA